MHEICKKSLEDIFSFFLYVGSSFQKTQVECLVIRRWAACGDMFFYITFLLLVIRRHWSIFFIR